jgi:hypothetical protein
LFPKGGLLSVHQILPPQEKTMDIQQLKLLAGTIRAFLQQAGVPIGHNESLEVAAALPGLRNWPEVMAFPDKVAAFELGIAAATRLAARLKKRYDLDMTPQAVLETLQAPEPAPVRHIKLKEHHLELFKDWESRLHAIFGTSIPTAHSWSGLGDIVEILQALSGSAAIHVFFPGGGGQDLGWVGESAEAGAIEFVPEKLAPGARAQHRAYMVRPDTLHFRVPAGNLLESHFVLTTTPLKATGVDALRASGFAEEVVNIGDGEYVERRYWDEGRLDDGREMPDDARVEIRYVQAARFAIFNKAALYNRLRGERFDAYSGIHQDAAAFDVIVEKLASMERLVDI